MTCPCGATLPGGSTWCPRCFAPIEDAPVRPEVGANGFLVTPLVGPFHEARMHSRWRGTAVSFGPTGRIVLTLLLLLPSLWFLLFGLAGPLGFVLWTFVVLPLALRDVWRRVGVSQR